MYRAMSAEVEAAREARSKVCIKLWQLKQKQKQLVRLELRYVYSYDS